MKYLILIIVFGLVACDQVTTTYDTYEHASKEQFFEKGWIPSDLIDSAISEIYLRDNLDLNTFIFSFKTDKKILENYEEGQKIALSDVHRVSAPNWWKEEIKGLTVYNYEPSEKLKLCLVYSSKTGKLYGWGKHEQ